jgi:hypothetical protein
MYKKKTLVKFQPIVTIDEVIHTNGNILIAIIQQCPLNLAT